MYLSNIQQFSLIILQYICIILSSNTILKLMSTSCSGFLKTLFRIVQNSSEYCSHLRRGACKYMYEVRSMTRCSRATLNFKLTSSAYVLYWLLLVSSFFFGHQRAYDHSFAVFFSYTESKEDIIVIHINYNVLPHCCLFLGWVYGVYWSHIPAIVSADGISSQF